VRGIVKFLRDSDEVEAYVKRKAAKKLVTT
jgi:hypothetical protein